MKKRRPLAVLPEHKHAVNRIIISILFATTCGGLSETPARHWAFQSVRQQAVPKVQNQLWAKTPVDRFILAGLESAGIALAPSANREQLIRRVTFGLLGLPPTPEEIDAFVSDRSPAAFDRLVDRLLASPRYGERWARHWLDLARYAESDGFEHDAVRPHSWRYRDYVIQSFNADKPYDRFLREQIAGDELWPDSPEALTATAFNLLGPDMVDSADQVQRRINTLNDMTDVSASVFLGLTLGCARCHHHKFEPLTQRDWLAGEFVAQGWSIKAMHRLILRSTAYQQSSEALPEALERDPENKLFSRQNRVRLEGEAIRDSLLAVSGRLNPTMFGPSVLPPLPADLATSAKNWTASSLAADHARRSIYVFARRNLRFPFFEVFDAPDNNVTCPERGRSVTAPQALTLLNSEEVLTAAGAAATRVMQEASSTDQRIGRAFQRALGRAPTPSEREKSRLFLREHRGGNQPPTQPAQTEFTALCRALFNLNAFVFVE